MQTYIVYFGLLLIIFILALIAERSGEKKYVFLIIFLLSLVAGLRKYTVGIDTQGYIVAIQNISNGNLNLAYGIEWTFRYICYAMSFIFKDPQMYLFLFALVTHGMIVYRFWELRNYISFRGALTGYYIMFYIISLNLMRQFIAISIVFYGTRFLKEKQWAFIIFVLLASMFHQSALLGLLYILFNFPAWKFLSKTQKYFLILLGIISPFIFAKVYKYMTQYISYFSDMHLNFGLMIIIKFGCLLVTICALNYTLKFSALRDHLEYRYLKSLTNISYMCGLLLTALGYAWKYVSRAGLYFYIFEAVYLGVIFKQRNTKNNFFIKLAYLVILSYQFWGYLTANGQGQIPYLFFWQ